MLVDGYVRVSQVAGRSGDRFISPAVQREQIAGWARLRRAHLGRIFEELDESGSRSDRPLLEEAIRRIEAGASDGIVVAKLDRFGRSLLDALVAIERIQAANGTFVSVEDGLDLSTDTGQLVLRILFSLAEWELDRIRRSWDVARERAVARGVFMGPRPPTGYKRGKDGHLHPDPRYAPLVSELFRRRANRAPLKELCLLMEAHGVLTSRGCSTWRSDALRDIFLNRAYLGEVHSGRYTKVEAHAALVDEDTFQLVQRPQPLRPHVGKGRPALLTSLVRCAGCRYCMQNHPNRLDDGYVVCNYTCTRRHAAGVCPSPTSVTAASIEPWVERPLFERCPRRNPRQGTERERALVAALARAEADLGRYRDSPRVLEALGPDRFAEGLEQRVRRLEHKRAEQANLRLRQRRPLLPTLTEMERLWPTLTILERRALLAEHIDCIFVAPGREIETRAHICWRGEGPTDLPARGYTPCEICRFVRPDGPVLRFHGPARRWSHRRIESELATFLDGRDSWPRFEEFLREGRRALHDQAVAYGGAAYWSEQCGVRYVKQRKTMVAWTAERVREELRIALRAGPPFPPKQN